MGWHEASAGGERGICVEQRFLPRGGEESQSQRPQGTPCPLHEGRALRWRCLCGPAASHMLFLSPEMLFSTRFTPRIWLLLRFSGTSAERSPWASSPKQHPPPPRPPTCCSLGKQLMSLLLAHILHNDLPIYCQLL